MVSGVFGIAWSVHCLCTSNFLLKSAAHFDHWCAYPWCYTEMCLLICVLNCYWVDGCNALHQSHWIKHHLSFSNHSYCSCAAQFPMNYFHIVNAGLLHLVSIQEVVCPSCRGWKIRVLGCGWWMGAGLDYSTGRSLLSPTISPHSLVVNWLNAYLFRNMETETLKVFKLHFDSAT